MLSSGTRKNPGKIILSQSISTPIGNMMACAAEEGICLLEFEERPDLDKQLKSLRFALGFEIEEGNHSSLPSHYRK
jgi:AraC family transcriptional regulator of adaptative response/methylated-DNA-[protein]-cysteine methyltransferase